MWHKPPKAIIQEILRLANISDFRVHNEKCYERILHDGALGLGESYMDHWWDCDRLDDFFDRLLHIDIEKIIKQNIKLTIKMLWLKLINLQTKKRALEVGKKHYDLGNELFEYMLDSRMNYTCGYWKDADNLEDAQLAKLELICQKLMLKPGMKILDIGCGFGAFAKYAAEKYQAHVVGITISEKQLKYAKENCKNLPVEIRFQDYRDLNNSFDRIVSIGMFEHVGYHNYQTYMSVVHRCLKENGLFLLHTIGDNISENSANEWTVKYIFPNGMLPSIAQIGKSVENLFVMEDWHNFGVYYDKTLMSWHHNFNHHWDKLKLQYDDRFYRMWNYYLLSSAGAFRARHIQLWQIVFSKRGLRDGYISPR